MKSIKCHSAVLMIKDIFTKVVLQAMRMDIMTYKTEIKKTTTSRHIQVPQVLYISCIQGIVTAGWLTTVNPFLSNHINDNLQPDAFLYSEKNL